MRNSMLAAALSGIVSVLILVLVMLRPAVRGLSHKADEAAQEQELSQRLDERDQRIMRSIAQREAIIADVIQGASLEEARLRFRRLNDDNGYAWTILELDFPSYTQDQRLDLQILGYLLACAPDEGKNRAQWEQAVARIKSEISVQPIPDRLQAVQRSVR
jgi:hypothetical protein